MKAVLLHGFLGNPDDWEGVIQHLEKAYECYALPLPEKLEEFPDLLDKYNIASCTLIGYSMGGRVALQLYQKYKARIEKLVLLSSHFGLKEEDERQKRWEEDCILAKKLETLPIDEFLAFWYSQPLFAGFEMPKRRLAIDKTYHSTLIRNYSLGKQPLLSPPEDALLLYGELDTKYKNIYRTFPQAKSIQGSAHAIHLQNPKEVADSIVFEKDLRLK
jgi:2-succinyl-6-hydroxy-2,4-cyclohexadiene-1-carboxylate synthase